MNARAQRWHGDHTDIATALASLSWTTILEMPGSSAAQRLLLHRLKSGRLSKCDRLHQRVGCPHCGTRSTNEGKLSHVFWDCPHTQQLWLNLDAARKHLWSAQRSPETEKERISSRFTLKLASVPYKLWLHWELTRLGPPTDNDTVATHLAVQAAWRQQVLSTLQTIWKWRTMVDEEHKAWTDSEAIAYHDACLRATLHGLQWQRTRQGQATCFPAAAL